MMVVGWSLVAAGLAGVGLHPDVPGLPLVVSVLGITLVLTKEVRG